MSQRVGVFLLVAIGVSAQTPIEPRIVSETLPAGGLMQIKLELTSPHPITTSGADFQMELAFDGVEGVAMLSPAGDAYGVAVAQGQSFKSNLVSPLASLGTQPGYPFLVIATKIRPGLAAGTKVPINFGATTFFVGPGGAPYTFPAAKNGVLTIGGSVSVTNIVPGGGVVPAGTTVRILGTGFSVNTRVAASDSGVTNVRYVSPVELNFTMGATTDLTGAQFRVRNRDNSEAVYYSYLRAAAMGASARALLNACHPLFPNQTAASAGLTLPASPANGFVAVALRNTAMSPVDVLLELVSGTGASLGRSNVSMPGGSQYMRTVQELFGTAPAGATARVTASGAIQILGLRGDESSGTVTAFPAGGAPVVTAQLTVSPATMVFDAVAGAAAPAAKSFSVVSTGAAMTYTAVSNAGWLTVLPVTGTTPGTHSAAVNPAGMAVGSYAGTVTLTAAGAAPQAIAVTLNVAPPQISVAPAALVFDGAGTRSVTVSTTGAALPFTASSSAGWLTASPVSGTAPGTLTVTANPAGLAPGTYTGAITVAATGSPAKTVAVTLLVTAVSQITVTPAVLVFNGTGTRNVTVSSTGTAVAYTASANVSWLTVSPAAGTTPGMATINANGTGLPPGTYSGAIAFTQTAAGANAPAVAVTLNVAALPQLVLTPGSLAFDAVAGQAAPAAKTISAGSTGTPLSYSVLSISPWVTVTPLSGQTPGTVTVSVSPAGLAAGSYSASIAFQPSGEAAGQTIPVALNVAPPPQLALSPAALSFDALFGGAAESKGLSVASTGAALTYSAASNASWLRISSALGQTPANLTVTADPAGLAAGTYTGTITVTSPAGARTVAVTLNVAPPPPAGLLRLMPSTLAFLHTAGGATPAAAAVRIDSGATPVSFAVSASVNWIRATASRPLTPATLTVEITPQGLPAGVYTGAVTLTPATGAAAQSLAVTLTVASGAFPAPEVSAIVNAASQSAAAPLAQGQIVTIYGVLLGPVTGQGPVMAAANRIDTFNAGTRVWFGSTPAPILYTSAEQVNAEVPYEVSGLTKVQVDSLGGSSVAREVFVAPAAPAIFTQDATGRGRAAVLNQDYSLNTPRRPAARGSAIMIYATGGGQTSPPSATGEIAGLELRTVTAPVIVTIGGRRVEALYAGAAPGLVTGLLQVNVLIPADIAAGEAVPVTITVGGAASPDGTTISIE